MSATRARQSGGGSVSPLRGVAGECAIADQIERAVRAGELLIPRRPVLVMYSGGRDSTCLLDLAVRIAGADVTSALHVNYGLRAAAEDEQRHCAQRCATLGVELVVRRAPPAPTAGNLQAWAREVRYAEAHALAARRGADIAVGHTASDQVETILYRLASSPSRRALLGMRAREGRLVRPLLALTREQVSAYCRERGLDWVEDESNESDAYARNRIRHGLLEALRAVHPAAERNILAVAQTLREEAEVLDQLIDAELQGREQIALERLRELPAALGRLIVQRLADAAAGRPAPGTARRLEEILALERGALDLPHGVRARVRDGVLRFERTPRRDGGPAVPRSLRPGPPPGSPKAREARP